MKTLSRIACALCLLAVLCVPASASEDTVYKVTITNLTRAQIISPPVVVAHDDRFSLFQVGDSASPGLAALAEDGMVGPLMSEVMDAPGVAAVTAAPDGIPPGGSMMVEIRTGGSARKISVAGMLVVTNDTFFAVRGLAVPRGRGTSSAQGPGYDAGSEENNELCDYIPGPPCMSPGQNAGVPEGFIHISNGIQGVGDLDPAMLDWRNPVAQVTIRKAD